MMGYTLLKPGHRLQQLDQMITEPYDHIWDCCCDHGLLGMSLLARQAAQHIHFVDIVPELITALEQKLQQYFPPRVGRSQWHVYCTDVAELNLPDEPLKPQRQLIIFAGISGERMITLVNALLNRHSNQNLDLLLCPIRHTYQLREALLAQNLGLINEKLVSEKRRFYELIHVSPTANQPIALVGSTMWDFVQQDHRDYLQQTIAHYQRKSLGTNNEAAQILAAYRQLHR